MRALTIAVVTIGITLTLVVGVAGYLVVSELRELTDELATVATLASRGIKVNGPVTASVSEWPGSVGIGGRVSVGGTTLVDVTGVVDANLGSRSINVDVGSVDVSAEVYSMPEIDANVDFTWPGRRLEVFDESR